MRLTLAQMSKLSNPDENILIGERLAAARELQQLSQVDFAEQLGLSPRAYQNYERGERELPSTVLTALHAVFGIDPLWVLIGQGRESRKSSASNKADVLEVVVVAVETHLQRTSKTLTPVKKARLIKLLYLHFQDRPKVDRTELATMLSKAA